MEKGEPAKVVSFGRYELTSKAKAGGGYQLWLRKGGELVSQDESTGDPLAKPEYLPDAPAAGCRTLVVKIFSGGAHCCTEAITISLCPDRPESLHAFNLMDSSDMRFIDVNGDGLREIELMDFSLTALEARVNGKTLSLPFSASPAPYRLLVLDGGRWRPDRPGEFGSYHRNRAVECLRQLKKLKVSDQDEICGLAVARAYHLLQAGDPEQVVRQELRKHLPAPWASSVQQVMKQVAEAAVGFDPVAKAAR